MAQQNKNIRLKARYKKHPDMRRLSRALVALAQAEAERAAQQQEEAKRSRGAAS